MKFKRIFLIVLDSLGVGATADAINFGDNGSNTLGHINDAAKIVKEKLYNALNPDGLVLVVNYGLTQEVKHYHLHLIPAYKKHQDLIDVEEIYNKIK